jgi:hypothetical protein
MTNAIDNPDHGTADKLTAAQVEKACPHDLQKIGERITVHLTRAAKCDEKAEQHRVAAGQLLAQAKEACDDSGFDAFRERFFPDLGRTRVYELLAIASGKKTPEEVRAASRERMVKHRAKKAEAPASVTVTDKPKPLGASRDDNKVEATTNAADQTPGPGRPRGGVSTPEDGSLIQFSATVMELVRKTAKQKPQRFAATSITPDDLAKLGNFLTDLANLKKHIVIKPIAPRGKTTVSAEQSAEDVKAQFAALDASDNLAA